MVVEGIAQTVVGTYASGHGHMLNARLLHGHPQLLHQDVDDGPFERGRQVFLMVFNEVGVFLNPFAQRIEERGLQSRETIVQSRDVRFGKSICLRVALTGQTVDDGAAGIAQPHDLRTLVDSFACCVVDGLPQHFHVVIGAYKHYLRVAAAH